MRTKCPAPNADVDWQKRIENDSQPKGMEFVYLCFNRDDTPESKSEFHVQSSFTGWLVDDPREILKRLGAVRTTEVMIVDPEERLMDHGAIDDGRNPSGVTKHHVKQALVEHLAAKPVTVKTSRVQA